MDKDQSPPLTGGCRCGKIRYAISKAPLFVMACHCTDCQEMTASAFSLGMPVAEEGFAIEGDPWAITKTADSGKESRAFRCRDCATWTHSIADGSPGVVIVRPTTLDDPDWIEPVAQIYLRSALPWAKLDVPHGYDKAFDDPSDIVATFAARGIRPQM